jgi:hypothetical protein
MAKYFLHFACKNICKILTSAPELTQPSLLYKECFKKFFRSEEKKMTEAEFERR